MKLEIKNSSMLLHVCCALCAIPILENLKSHGNKSTLYFFNPNIFPQNEHQKRLETVKKIAAIFSLKIIEEKYNHKEWLDFITKRLPEKPEKYPENGPRCLPCVEFRLQKTAEFARKNNFKTFATTLSTSRFKDVKFINRFSENLVKKLNLQYVAFSQEMAKNHRATLDFAKQHNLYRQKYCGCEFALPRTRFQPHP